jgi:(R,R)-butanediol dehydrogenase / meso-butanediol dehydrogenase / diacetyl reductase
MKGIVFRGDRACEVREFPVPNPGPTQVRIRVMATGICGSDLSVYRGTTARDGISGHEPSGIVDAVGSSVVALSPGDRVTVHHHQGCGACPVCAHGDYVACLRKVGVYGVQIPGSFAEYMVAEERNCVRLPDSVSFIDGAFMACVGGTAYAALLRLGANAHDILTVSGLGPVGLSCVILGQAMGCQVVGIDALAHRLDLGRQCGCAAVINATEQDVPAAISAFSRTVGTSPFPGSDLLIETSGATAARRAIIPSLRRGGKAAIVGVGSTEEVINPSSIHGKACTLLGSVVYTIGWMWDLAAFLDSSGTSFEPAVTHRFSLDDGPEALRTADQCTGGKVVILPHG